MFLGQLAQDYADRYEHGKDIKHHVQYLQHAEDKRAAFQQIKYALKPMRSSVNRVQIENDDSMQRIVSNKEEMEEEIVRVNVKKLLQVDNTPLRQEPLCSWFSEDRAFDDGVLGLLPNFEAEEGIRLWIKNIQNIPIIETKTTWTTEEYVDSWSKMKEMTTPLLCQSFSHFKAT